MLQADDFKAPTPRKGAMAGLPLDGCTNDLCREGLLCESCKKFYRRQTSRTYKREEYRRDPGKSRERWLEFRYGLTPATYRALLESQGNVCAICRLNKKLTVDHNHSTGAIRGILCSRCNSRLAALDDREWLEEAEKYRTKA